ncbi:unnamed protein product, partial [marine sediment metagenome]
HTYTYMYTYIDKVSKLSRDLAFMSNAFTATSKVEVLVKKV